MNLDFIEVRGSLGTLLSPKVKLVTNSDGTIDISLKINVPDAKGMMGNLQLESRHPLTDYTLGRMQRSHQFAGKLVRNALKDMLDHEIDESLFVDDDYFQIPKHWGPVDK